MTNEEMRELCNMLKQLIENSKEEKVQPATAKSGKYREKPTVQLTTYIPLEYKMKIQETARKRTTSQTNIVREAIVEYYNNHDIAQKGKSNECADSYCL